jgi:hypothetical protein
MKTALVHISCIQNTQIRGETTAKVFGKIDTFCTYQRPAKGWADHARRGGTPCAPARMCGRAVSWTYSGEVACKEMGPAAAVLGAGEVAAAPSGGPVTPNQMPHGRSLFCG